MVGDEKQAQRNGKQIAMLHLIGLPFWDSDFENSTSLVSFGKTSAGATTANSSGPSPQRLPIDPMR